MRRPLKPFVTEYKGSARRQKETAAPGPKTESAADAGWGVKAPYTNLAEPNADADSYEAALRAADALFTRAPSKPRPDERPRAAISEEQPSDPRDHASDAKLQGDPSAGAQPNGIVIERAGRILRVIDEPAADPFAQMEAERAPKKRGRKPGSKNKPKPALTVVPALEADSDPPVAREEAEASEAIAQSPAVAARLRHAVKTARPPSTSSYKSQRFAWVRKQLGPGEQWKRNLPKVIW